MIRCHRRCAYHGSIPLVPPHHNSTGSVSPHAGVGVPTTYFIRLSGFGFSHPSPTKRILVRPVVAARHTVRLAFRSLPSPLRLHGRLLIQRLELNTWKQLNVTRKDISARKQNGKIMSPGLKRSTRRATWIYAVSVPPIIILVQMR